MPPHDWLIAGDSLQQAGVGLARRGWAVGCMGGWAGGGEKGEQEAGVKGFLPPLVRLCGLLLSEHAVLSHTHTHTINTCKGSQLNLHALPHCFPPHLPSHGCL